MALSVYKILTQEHLNGIISKLSVSPLFVQPPKGIGYGMVKDSCKVNREI